MSFYIFAYLFANMGAFAVVTIFEDNTGSCEITSYRGLSRTSPAIAGVMTVFLLSLAGIPPLAGFFAKYYVFLAAIEAAGSSDSMTWLYWTVGVGLVTSVFSLYYYANVIKQMYFSKDDSPYRLDCPAPATAVLIIGVVGVFLFGLFPEQVLQFAANIPNNLGLFTN